MRPTYIRFVTEQWDTRACTRRGPFHAIGDLVDENELYDYQLEEIQSLRGWFADELKSPNRFSRSRKSGAVSRAICWFKSTATEHVSRMYDLRRILGEHGIPTEVLRSARPGYIVYEDDYQVARRAICGDREVIGHLLTATLNVGRDGNSAVRGKDGLIPRGGTRRGCQPAL